MSGNIHLYPYLYLYFYTRRISRGYLVAFGRRTTQRGWRDSQLNLFHPELFVQQVTSFCG